MFTIAVDLVMADGQASTEERKFIDGLQGLLQVPDETAMKIVEVIIMKNSVDVALQQGLGVHEPALLTSVLA